MTDYRTVLHYAPSVVLFQNHFPFISPLYYTEGITYGVRNSKSYVTYDLHFTIIKVRLRNISYKEGI